MEMIILNLLSSKFCASFIAASQHKQTKSSLKNQKYFTKVSGRGKCHIVFENCHIF